MIIRGPRPEGNFYILDKKISEDRRLSWAARGLLIFLLGKPNHWQVSVSALVNETAGSARATGRDATWSLLRELIDVRYCVRRQVRKTDGTMGEMDYLISEEPPDLPLPLEPRTAYPCTAYPGTVNPTQVSIDLKQGLKKKKGLSRASTGNPILKTSPRHKAQIPADFKPDAKGMALADKLGADLNHELDTFIAHHTGHETTMPNWQAGFQGWLLKGVKFTKPGTAPLPQAVSKTWHESKAGIAAKAAELGMAPHDEIMETAPAFKARVKAEARKRGAA